MGISTDKGWRLPFIFFCIVAMLFGLFTSRVLLSSATILFLLFTCVHKNFFQQFRWFMKNYFLLGVSLLFIIPFISWFWSEDKQMWWRFIRIKLPLLLLPIAFAGNWQLSSKHWRWIAGIFLMLVFAGSCWSLWQYAQNSSFIHAGYLRAKVMPTPFENDHVRYSLVVCIAVLCAALMIKTIPERPLRLALVLLSLFFIVYLHILSARTGLASLYILLVLGGGYLAFTRRIRKWVLTFFFITIAMPLLAWYFLPTFQNRIRYNLYDFSSIRENSYVPGANDGNRVISLKAGWSILRQNPMGVGSGDVINKTNDWYAQHIPQMLETDKLYPSSEWLMYGAAAGWAGFLLFTMIMLLPFFEKIKQRLFWFALNIITGLSLLFDIGLEVQFGVFIHAFFLLWWWKWLPAEHKSGQIDS